MQHCSVPLNQRSFGCSPSATGPEETSYAVNSSSNEVTKHVVSTVAGGVVALGGPDAHPLLEVVEAVVLELEALLRLLLPPLAELVVALLRPVLLPPLPELVVALLRPVLLPLPLPALLVALARVRSVLLPPPAAKLVVSAPLFPPLPLPAGPEPPLPRAC